MARPSEYDFDILKQYKNIDVIYGLYTEEQGIRYIGYSKNVYLRFRNHLINHISETNYKKSNWIEKYKNQIKIEILSVNPIDWELEEIKFIKKYSKNNLLNICSGGKSNIHKKEFEQMTCEEHLKDANKALRELNKYYKDKGKLKVFKLLTKEEIKHICEFPINKKLCLTQ
jgi:hypothetical protein